MSLRTEINDRGLVPTLALLLLSLGSANRGAQQFFDTDLVALLPAPLPAWVMTAVGVVGLVTLVELTTNFEVFPDDLRV